MYTNQDNSLSAIVRQINDCWGELSVLQENVSNVRLEIGRLLIKAKEQVPHGEWASWYAQNFPNRSLRDGQRCMKMAGADDPEAALAAEQKAAAARMQQHRNKLKSDEHSSFLTRALAQIEDARPKPLADTWNFAGLPKAPTAGADAATETAAPQPSPDVAPATFLPYPVEFERAVTRINRDLAWLTRHGRLNDWVVSVAEPAELLRLLWRRLPVEMQQRLRDEFTTPPAAGVAARSTSGAGTSHGELGAVAADPPIAPPAVLQRKPNIPLNAA